MKFALFFALCAVSVATLATGQLIIDDDDPAGQRIIKQLVEAINKHENDIHDPYGVLTYKSLIYTLGDFPNYQVYLKVVNTANKILSCTVELHDEGHDKYTTGTVKCHESD